MNRIIRTTAWAVILFSLLTVKTAQPQLANTPWPMFQHNPQHTGRSPLQGLILWLLHGHLNQQEQ